MRTSAQVSELPLAIKRDALSNWELSDDLSLVLLSLSLEQLDYILACHRLPGYGQIGPRELFHLCLNRCKVGLSKPRIVGKIVVEAVLDHRTDSNLRLRV